MSVSLRDPSLLRTQCFVDGQWVDGSSGKRFPVLNPANGETLAEVARAGGVPHRDRRDPVYPRLGAGGARR